MIHSINRSLPLQSQNVALDSRSRTSTSVRSVTLSDLRSTSNENQSNDTTRVANRTMQTNPESGIGSGQGNQTTTRQVRLLEYPRDFFNKETGAGPSTPEEAERLWIYRKN